VFQCSATPELSEGHGFGSSNYLALDKNSTLNWIWQNIFLSGGDPDNVKLICNPGGSTVAHHLQTSLLADRLFNKFIGTDMFSKIRFYRCFISVNGPRFLC